LAGLTAFVAVLNAAKPLFAVSTPALSSSLTHDLNALTDRTSALLADRLLKNKFMESMPSFSSFLAERKNDATLVANAVLVFVSNIPVQCLGQTELPAIVRAI